MNCSVFIKIGSIAALTVAFTLCSDIQEESSQKSPYQFLYDYYYLPSFDTIPVEIKKQFFSNLIKQPIVSLYNTIKVEGLVTALTFIEGMDCLGASTPNKLILFSIKNGSMISSCPKQFLGVPQSLSFHKATQGLVTGSDLKIVSYYSIKDATFQHTNNNNYSTTALLENFRPLCYAAGTDEGAVLFITHWADVFRLDCETKTTEHLFTHPTETPLASICVNSQGKMMACAHTSGRVDLIDLDTKKIKKIISETIPSVESIDKEAYNGLSFSGDGENLYIPYKDHLAVFNLATQEITTSYKEVTEILSTQPHPLNNTLIMVDKAGNVLLGSIPHKEWLADFPSISSTYAANRVHKALFNKNGRIVALLNEKREISLYYYNLLVAYLRTTEIDAEKLLFITFILDLSLLPSLKNICKDITALTLPISLCKIVLTEGAVPSEYAQYPQADFFVHHAKELTTIFKSCDTILQKSILHTLSPLFLE